MDILPIIIGATTIILVVLLRKQIAVVLDALLAFLQRVVDFLKRQWSRFIFAMAWFAGADLKLMKQMPSSVIEKRSGFGFAMFMAVFASAFVTTCVWTSIKGPTAGLLIGILWFVLMWTIDRMIVIYMDHDVPGFTWKKGAVVAGRLLLVFGLSGFNSTVAEMMILDTEIHQVLVADKQATLSQLNDSIDVANKPLESEKRALVNEVRSKTDEYTLWTTMRNAQIKAAEDSLRARENMWIGEIEGIVGSGKKGYGPAAKAKREAISQDSIRLVQARIDFENEKLSDAHYMAIQSAEGARDVRTAELNILIAKNVAYQEKETARINALKDDGFIDRYHALHTVAGDAPVFAFIIFLIFFCIEALVVILKLLSKRDAYDEAIKLQSEEFVADKQHSIISKIQQAKNSLADTLNEMRAAHAKNSAESVGKIMLQENIHLSHERQRIKSIKEHLEKLTESFEEMEKSGISSEEIKRIKNETVHIYKPVPFPMFDVFEMN